MAGTLVVSVPLVLARSSHIIQGWYRTRQNDVADFPDLFGQPLGYALLVFTPKQYAGAHSQGESAFVTMVQTKE